MPASVGAVAGVMARRARIARSFASAGATSPQTARDPEELGVTRGHVFRRMVKGGVVKEAQAGRFWFDGAADAAFRRRALWTVAGVLCVGVVAVVVAVLLAH